MKTLQKGISIALLALLGLASVAVPAASGRGQEDRGQGREMRQNDRSFERPQPPADRAQTQPGADNSGRHGRMSPEEKRALRQQINEANQDIFKPRR